MKGKTISLRVEVPQYAEYITKAHENNMSLTDYIIHKVEDEQDQEDVKKLENIVEEQKKQILSFKYEKDKLSKELQKKPKEIIKEVPIKVENKAQLESLKKKYTKELQEQNKRLKTHIKDLETLTDKVYKLETSLKLEKNKCSDLANKNKKLQDDKAELSGKIKRILSFVNNLDLRKHDDGYSIGGRTFSEGEPIQIE